MESITAQETMRYQTSHAVACGKIDRSKNLSMKCFMISVTTSMLERHWDSTIGSVFHADLSSPNGCSTMDSLTTRMARVHMKSVQHSTFAKNSPRKFTKPKWMRNQHTMMSVR